MIEDATLLHRYARERSEEAFAELVRRYFDLVYSAALRRSNGDPHVAADVAQLVFATMARDAAALAHHAVLAGWLYAATRNAALNALRAEKRRRARETEAHTMNEQSSTEVTPDWHHLRPVLDAAMDELETRDREAVLLRFFQSRPFGEVAQVLCVSEDTARKRVERAVDKLRALLSRRGIVSTAVALETVLATEAVTAAPAGLASAVTTATLAAATTAGATGSILFLMSMTKPQLAILATLVLASGVGLALQHQSNTALRDERETYRNQEEASRQARAAAEKRAEDSLAKAAEFETQLVAAQAKLTDATRALAAVKSPATGNEQPRGPAPVVLSKAEWLALMKEHPELMEAQDIEVKYNIQSRYGALFKNMGLTPEQIAQFERLLIDKGHAMFDVYAAAVAQGIDPDKNKEDFNRLMKATESDIEGKIKSLLGDSGYVQMQTYDRTMVQRGAVRELQMNLAYSPKPLAADQVEPLVKVLAEAAPDLGRTGVIPSEAVAQVQGILAPEQMLALQAMQQKVQSGQRYNETLQKIFGKNVRGMSVR